MLVGVVGFLGSEVVLSPVSPVVSLHVGGGCWLVWPPSWALKWSCLPLSPVVSLHVGGGCWLVWPHLEQKHSEIKITGFNLNLLTVNCLGSTLVYCLFPSSEVVMFDQPVDMADVSLRMSNLRSHLFCERKKQTWLVGM